MTRHFSMGVCTLLAGISFISAAQRTSAAPDVVVSTTGGIGYQGTVGSVTGYAVGTTSCNIGSTQLSWFSGNNQHPVIAQNMYRLKGGRFEQVGMSWVKHGWCAADGGTCGSAGGPPTCSSASGCDWLGIGCTDTYGVGLNADQTDLGPRSEINAYTGVFAYPYGLAWNQTGNAIYKRLQTLTSDIDPAQNAGAQYFIEGHYIHPGDAASAGGVATNNASYRAINITSATSNPTTLGSTFAQQPAILAWQAQDPTVTIANVDVPSEGRFIIGSKVTDNGNGTWHYEYAVFNLNSHRSAQSFSVEVGSAAVSNVGFHDVFYHSGEPYDGTDWAALVSGGSVTWATHTFAENQNANALRFSTLYNFRFDCDTAPAANPGNVTLGLFRPGTPTSVMGLARVPQVLNCACWGDLDSSNTVDGEDIPYFVNMFLGTQSVAPCADNAGPHGVALDANDMDGFVNRLLTIDGCP